MTSAVKNKENVFDFEAHRKHHSRRCLACRPPGIGGTVHLFEIRLSLTLFSIIAVSANRMPRIASPGQTCAYPDRTVRYKHQALQRWHNDLANVHARLSSPFP